MYDSEASAYYMDFSASQPWHFDPAVCPCRGRGWLLSEVDTWHSCRYHKDETHPEDPEGGSSLEEWEAKKLVHLRSAFGSYRALVESAGFQGDFTARAAKALGRRPSSPEGWVAAAREVAVSVGVC